MHTCFGSRVRSVGFMCEVVLVMMACTWYLVRSLGLGREFVLGFAIGGLLRILFYVDVYNGNELIAGV